jgi:HAD superfamily hydrolase (TIGR01509 family)
MLLDMDGTLVDNMMVHHEAWRVALAERGLHMTIDEVQEQIHGVNHEILLRLFGDSFTEVEAERFAWEKEEAYRNIYAADIALISGAQRFLDQAKALNVPMALATAAPMENVDFVFKHLPLQGHFPVVKHAGDVQRGKPDPQVFELAATELGVNVGECLVFEDSITGAHAANNAGADAVILTTTHAQAEFDEFAHIVRFTHDFEALEISGV